MPQPLDAAAVRRWCLLALDALGRAREDIDAINVFPVADGDTGTNLYLTVESAAQAVAAAGTGSPTLAEAARSMAHGALIGARGNSGTILAQLLRGMAEVLAEGPDPAEAATVRRALRRAVESAYEAVAHPVEGTMLTVASAAAEAAEAASGALPEEVVAAAGAGAGRALEATPGQLAALAEAGVVDAGGRGLVAVLDALQSALSGGAPGASPRERLFRAPGPRRTDRGGAAECRKDAAISGAAPPAGETPHAPGPFGGTAHAPGAGGPGTPEGALVTHEVIYLLEAADSAVAGLRARLDALGDSLVVVGGDGLWNVHVHTARPGAAVEAGIEAGRPHRIRITALAAAPHAPARGARAVVSLLPGDGLAGLCEEAGALALTVRQGEPPGAGELTAVIQRTRAAEVVLLPNDDGLWHAASAAAEQARAAGLRVAVVPTRSPVQGIAALAVHAPERRFDEDVVAMTSAAGATRFGEVAVAERQSWTMAGICQAGDVLGLVDGDVAVIGAAADEVAGEVLERMLSAGGELVTLVLGASAPAGLADRLRERVRRGHLGVDTVVYEGRQDAPLLIGVE
ncbi:DAK2 domain-containing protein [Streptomyces hoynatensis]|uniref:DAK2 domain-containing protein n=1 Tax=Streptomyces hoynatensis TaxID=1141874 RepID=A0A3A9YS54_9ACTN|nr:DAK2 domain-containing protein [Streptomyces hoynatensis]RKN38810.1 DAK2 domain-containing protein [Streptomyces hoynatensis]